MNWTNFILKPQRYYGINFLYNKGLIVSGCPSGKCGWYRFQRSPEAKCQGRRTCWMSEHIKTEQLAYWGDKYVRGCDECGKYFIVSSLSKTHCSKTCAIVKKAKCEECEKVSKKYNLFKYQILTCNRAKGKSVWGDTSKYVSFHGLFCNQECAKKHVKSNGYYKACTN